MLHCKRMADGGALPGAAGIACACARHVTRMYVHVTAPAPRSAIQSDSPDPVNVSDEKWTRLTGARHRCGTIGWVHFWSGIER